MLTYNNFICILKTYFLTICKKSVRYINNFLRYGSKVTKKIITYINFVLISKDCYFFNKLITFCKEGIYLGGAQVLLWLCTWSIHNSHNLSIRTKIGKFSVGTNDLSLPTRCGPDANICFVSIFEETDSGPTVPSRAGDMK